MSLFTNWFTSKKAKGETSAEENVSDPTADIPEALFTEAEPPETIYPIQNPQEQTLLGELKSKLQNLSNTDRKDEGFKDCTYCPETSALQEGCQRIVQKNLNEVGWTITRLEEQILEHQRMIVQLEEIGRKNKAYMLEAIKMKYEAFRNECKEQQEEIKMGQGWVSSQLNTYRAGFNNALEMHIMNGFNK